MTTALAAPVTAALTALYAELAAEIPDALNAEFSFATIWCDLCRIADEPVPRDVALCLDTPLDLIPIVPVLRGSYAAHAAQFPAYAD